MSKPSVLVLRAAGVNCNEETAHAFTLAGGDPKQIHINRLLENPKLLDDFGMLAIPGGFSYGDDVAAGAVLGLELNRALGDSLRGLVDRGGLVLGICNGFQVLMRSGLLPGNDNEGTAFAAALTDNVSRRYEDRWVRLAPLPERCRFLEDNEVIELPAAHAEGRLLAGTTNDLAKLQSQDRVAFRYINAEGGAADYPDNPNGSQAGIAGLTDETGSVLGLMPHPERYLFGWQHPRWTREGAKPEGDGLRIFKNAVRALKS